MRRITIVGFSLAGLRAAEALRRVGFAGEIVAIGDEAHLPYDRPPLSKDLLAGEWEPEQTLLRRQGLDDLDLDLRLDARAVGLDADDRIVELHDGERIPADGVVVATGSTPRRLPVQPELAGVFTLRTLDDALAIRELLESDPPVAVVGAGFIGSEVAATCRGRGLDVTVLEALEQPMVRGVGPVVGEVLAGLHRDHGVDLRLGVAVAAIEGSGRVERVVLGDGSSVAATVVVVGIGVVPATGWLEGSGLVVDDGVVCDETCRAAPGIVAAGDVARWPNPLFDGASMRLEHWTNASEQGVYAAQRLLADIEGADEVEPFAPVPFVWSDQYDVKIQTVGHFRADDELRVVHGSTDERRFVALYGRAGRLTGAMGLGRPRQVMQYRQMIAARASWDEALAHASTG